MSNSNKHNFFWWVFIILWWVYIGWWWRPLKWLVSYLLRKVSETPQTTPEKAPTPTETAPTPTKTEPQPKVERHHVAGTSFRVEVIEAMGVKNFDYDKSKRELIEDGLINERIWRTEYFPTSTTLEPEPDNPADPKAIKVVVDGVHIGYIKKGSCAHLHKALREESIDCIKCEIKGGEYKIVLEDFNEDGDSVYTLDNDDVPLCAELYITLK